MQIQHLDLDDVAPASSTAIGLPSGPCAARRVAARSSASDAAQGALMHFTLGAEEHALAPWIQDRCRCSVSRIAQATAFALRPVGISRAPMWLPMHRIHSVGLRGAGSCSSSTTAIGVTFVRAQFARRSSGAGRARSSF
jgi:hypothetical protein